MNRGLVLLLSTVILVGIYTGFTENTHETKLEKMTKNDAVKTRKATFAGGCFWCMQPPFDELTGVVSTTVGYTGGQQKNPTYQDVTHGKTGHAESIEIIYDPSKISYDELLSIFWRNIDPTTRDGQFVDMGRQYRTAIFYHSAEQKKHAYASKAELEKSDRFKAPIVTEITPASTFYVAEEYHQKYYKKNPAGYKRYRRGSGRDQFLSRVWGSQSARRR